MTTPTSWLISGLLLCLALSQRPVAAKSRYNISFAQLDTCDSINIDTSSGYAYKDFFMVHTLDNNNIKSNERLHLKFYVLTSMDAHILLSVTSHPRNSDRVYEIVIGAGGNTFSAIRTSMGLRRVSTNQDSNLLSIYEPTPIEIVQTKDGDLSVYIPGFKTEPLLHFLDASALNINYISFSTFGSNSARWFYDCAFDGYTNEMEQEQRKQSFSEQLLGNLIFQAQNSSLPTNLTEIKFNFQMRSLAYDQSSALLHTRMQLVLHWYDPRLHWEPESYGQIKSFVHPQLQIWLPQIIALNAALDGFGDVLRNFEVRVYSNGNITVMASNLELSTWCVDTAKNWPNELINCNIELGIEENGGRIALTYDHEQRPLAPNEHVNTPSGWTFVEIEVSHVDNTTAMRYTSEGSIQTISGDVSIGFTIQRNSNFYRHVFVMPIVACQIFIVLSFLLRGYRRGALILIVLLLTAWGLMYLTRHASPSYVPPMMSHYQHIMSISVYCYLLHIAIMWLERYPPRDKPAKCVMAMINWTPLRFILGLRFSDATEYCEIQEQPWRQLSKMLNNGSFIVINIFFIVLSVLEL
ncbi:neuronal acetylcholine receptor subunit beta-4 [Drosophila innubila]|uniref:neuronal acetylcholine receptor subunit beta-4 n=1 Tax=Drosophila innubila TaxID=198719 RepID=UPI00148C2D9B|nr:neuronal acetylcholine receptor subunit beta-4 [Drosophila innubila]